MFPRRSLHLPITLAILMIVLLVALTVGWILLTSVGLQTDQKSTVLWITLLSVGTTCLVLVLLGTVLYLWLSIKAINLTQRQSNFIDSVTHELKSPIASIKLCLQTLTRRPVEEEQRDNFYAYMLADVERLDHLINHILQAARLEKGRQETALEVVDLAALLTGIAESIQVRQEVPSDAIRLHLTPCWVACSALDLDLIFRNLIDNAVKYGGDPPQVDVTIGNLSGGRAIVTVRDNGSGVPKKLRRKIFSRFVRLGSELQRKKPGTGLGLYIVRTLVARWKGRIRVRESENTPGTIFEVELSAAQAFSPPLDASPKRMDESASNRNNSTDREGKIVRTTG